MVLVVLFGVAVAHAKLTQPSTSNTVEYTVRSGDTLFAIARAHHTTIDEVRAANGLERDAIIKVGQVLRVPQNTYFPDRTPAPAAKTVTKSAPAKPPSSKTSEAAPSPAPATTADRAKGTYTVQPGDTLFSIARKNRIVISKLMRINGIGLGDSLRVGQVLKVSESASFVPAPKQQPSRTASSRPSSTKESQKLPVGTMPSYRVKKGDTLWGIARKHHLTLAQIRALNKMGPNDTIRVGMLLAVGDAVKPTPKTYKVKKGDTLWLIAKKYDTTTKRLRKLNGLSRTDTIHTGMVLALSEDAAVPTKKPKRTTDTLVAELKKLHAKPSEIKAVLAKVKSKKITNPNPKTLLASVRKSKAAKQSKTKVARTQSRTKSKRYSSASAILSGRHHGADASANRTIRIAKRYLGRRYVWGATGPRAFDCSGFTQYVMRKSKGITLPRISRKQAYYGKYVSRRNLRPGDLVFFDTSRRRRGYVNHVGIYIGNNKFIHASSGKHRVVITSLSRPFYSARFKWGRRIN
jgi:cell wall-associated NlpC family hydrolase